MSNILGDRMDEVLNTYLEERKNQTNQTNHRLSQLNIVRDAI